MHTNKIPCKSDKEKKEIYISNDKIKIHFGQASTSDFTLHKDEASKKIHINRHKKNESKFWNKSGSDTQSFGAR